MADTLTRKIRLLERRLRQKRRELERVNPVDDPGRYRAMFEQVAALEARRRTLRTSRDAGLRRSDSS